MKQPISITAISSLSALGTTPNKIWEAYLDPQHYLVEEKFGNDRVFIGALSDQEKQAVAQLRSETAYKNLDPSVLYAVLVARKAVAKAQWKSGDSFGVNFGSSRGATTLFESYYQNFLEKGSSETLSSPTTTLGNISSWVAHDLKTKGPDISHSITCSTGLHSLLNGIAWLQSGLAHQFLVGASEAALTPFTIAQMQALRVCDKSLLNENKQDYPCRALDLSKKRNSMVLGEGAVALCIESWKSANALADIIGIGYATETLTHNASISAEATCFQDSMKMAIGMNPLTDIDVIITHTPGTIQGDVAEMKAIEKVFGSHIPAVTTNKWKLGHTFATSGLLSLELAILMLQKQQLIRVPYLNLGDKSPNKIEKVLVNAVGFGGNAVSVLVSLPQA